MTKSKTELPRPEISRRTGRARTVADIVPDVGRAAFRRFGFVQSSVVSRWREIVGDRYAEVTAPESIRFAPGRRGDGVLSLTVEGAYAPMVQHVVPEIIERVNRFFGYGAVARIAIKHGRVEPRAPRRPVPVPTSAIPTDMSSGLKLIEDDGLRACLESLAAQLCTTNGLPKIG